MVKPVVKATMRTLAIGNKPTRTWALGSNSPLGQPHGNQHGFTLLELLVVLTIIALASAGVVVALPEPRPLERDAQRLAALLEAERAQARASGMPLEWRSTPQGFEFGFFHPSTRPSPAPHQYRWLLPEVQAQIEHPSDNGSLRLGPEPLLPAQSVRLRWGMQQTRIVSDGLKAFQVVPVAP